MTLVHPVPTKTSVLKSTSNKTIVSKSEKSTGTKYSFVIIIIIIILVFLLFFFVDDICLLYNSMYRSDVLNVYCASI